MGSIWTRLLRNGVERVGNVIQRYEVDASLAGIDDWNLMLIPKSFLMSKVRCVDLEMVWHRLPEYYQSDEDLIKCRPCVEHQLCEGDVVDGCIRRRDCRLCRCRIK